MPRTMDNGRLGLLAVAASAFAYATAGLFTRLIDLDVWTILFWRGIVAGLTVGAFVAWRERRGSLAAFGSIGRAGLLVASCSAFATICFINALRLTTVADVMVINAVTPFATAGLAWAWLGERERRATLIASAVALCGVGLMVEGAVASGHLAGNGLAVLTMLSIAAMMVIIRHERNVSMLPATCLSAFLCAALVLPFAAPASPRGIDWLLLVLFGSAQFGLGLLLMTIGTRLISATRSALVGSLDVPLGPALVWLAYGETPALATLLGGAIVMAAVVGEILL